MSSGQENFGAARALVRMMGGFEAMVGQGTHLDDLMDNIIFPDPNVDQTSLRQLQEIAGMMGIAPDGTDATDATDRRSNPYEITYVDMRPREEEPLVAPEVARHWLLKQTHRAIEEEDGSIRLRPDQKPDHLGFAALAIAKGEEPRLFSETYAMVTDNESPLAQETIERFAKDMVRTFNEESER